ncbi:Hypothetical protein MAU_1690 [Metamycoplasma auris 15026]|uniref:Uncharacterized protein n=1 Tax=Metamycoplasma auris 15026 TaxID=1188233 RepID=N9VBS6_9BACT|nr:hypothetical protein [Metamycoplasma auris]ENY69128.1 Hypothetical protein MAU_1690 [Metamycoplasma auris 15026]
MKNRLKHSINNLFYETDFADIEKYINDISNIASSKETEPGRAFYVDMLEKIFLKLEDFNDRFKIKVIEWLATNPDLDEIISLYYMTCDVYKHGAIYNDLTDDFFEKEDIHSFKHLWEEMDSDLRTNGIDANIYLLKDLLEVQDTRNYVKLDGYNRGVEIDDIEKEFHDWVSDQEIEYLLSYYPFSVDDYLDDPDVMDC